MSVRFDFDNSYAALPEGFFAPQQPVPVKAPKLLAWNDALAADLGLPEMSETDRAQIFAGNSLPEGAFPLAQAYAGHQFGGFSPQLGDGRAILLGEIVTPAGRRDIQLKGAGRTPFSRGGDGRAWLGPVLREFLVSEAMAALGVPTTRALAMTATGETIFREKPLPGAVLTRVAQSHLRVGTFEFYAARGDITRLRQLFTYARDRHDPEAADPRAFMTAVIDRQAKLVAQWLGLGFIHGVMNTDNTTISGETIDYGPCAFMDGYHPGRVYSSIDRMGRYAYDQQPAIITWNMAQLASSLLLLEEDADAALPAWQEIVNAMPGKIAEERRRVFGAKLGLAQPTEEDDSLIDDLLALMANQEVDFTNAFHGLSDGTGNDTAALFAEASDFDAWRLRWQARLRRETGAEARMARANPAIIPRNHRIEEAIQAAVAGDMAPFARLRRALATPYAPSDAELALPPRPEEEVRATFCGT